MFQKTEREIANFLLLGSEYMLLLVQFIKLQLRKLFMVTVFSNDSQKT